MNIEKRVRTWLDAKVIDQPQADRILAFEREHYSSSWILYGLCGLGVVVVACGLISIFAANWESIPPSAKLFLYFVTLTLLGVGASKLHDRSGVLRESLLTAFGLFVLAGIGLIGQIYSLEGESYQALFFWLTIILPVTLTTQSRLLNTIWIIGLEGTVGIWLFSESPEYSRILTAVSVPYLLIATGYAGSRFLPSHFCDAARFWGYVTIFVPFAIIGNIGWAQGGGISPHYPVGLWPIVPFGAAALALAAILTRNFLRGTILSVAMLLTVVTSAILFIVPLTQGVGRHEIIGCALFILVWCGAAILAAATSRKRLFDFAAFVIGVRFIVVYFEVFGSLAATGAGLIVSGAVILGIAYLWHRFRGKVAKAIQEQA